MSVVILNLASNLTLSSSAVVRYLHTCTNIQPNFITRGLLSRSRVCSV